METFKYAKKRTAGNKKNYLVIPWNKMEDIIFYNTKRMFQGAASIEECLEAIDSNLAELMRIYGHFWIPPGT
jgi:hypothetical protein